jgi:hypothetical protein
MLPHPFLLIDSASAFFPVCHLGPDVGTIFDFISTTPYSAIVCILFYSFAHVNSLSGCSLGLYVHKNVN